MQIILYVSSGHQERVWSAAWSPAGSLLASSGADKAISLDPAALCMRLAIQCYRECEYRPLQFPILLLPWRDYC